jgi:hypothetical protein
MTVQSRRRMLWCGVLVLGALGGAAAITYASDHQDTPEVELSPRMDINDVYAFPGASADRTVLVMTTSSPITPAQASTAAFDPNLLYQLKVDNTGDGIEDLVLQFTFDGNGTAQRVNMRGPVRPTESGTRNTIVSAAPAASGALNQTISGSGGIQLFAGLRDDPFFIDLEQFFRILPDRRPASGPYSVMPTPASAFRNPGVDFLRTINTLAIIVEMPTSMLTAGGGTKIGVWGTISR